MFLQAGSANLPGALTTEWSIPVFCFVSIYSVVGIVFTYVHQLLLVFT